MKKKKSDFLKKHIFLEPYSHLLMILHWIVIITKKFEVLAFIGLLGLALFFKQELAFADKNWAQLTCFQQSDWTF